MRYLRYTLIMLLAFIVSLGVEAKKVKLSKNIVYEGAVQNGEPNGKGCLKVYSCLDKNLTLLTLDGVFDNTEVKDANLMINGGMKITAPSIYFYKIATPSKKEDAIDFQINSKWSIENTKSVKIENASSAYIRCRCDMKSDKRWHFVSSDESKQLSILNNGVILSYFTNYDIPLSVIGEDASNIKKQDVCYKLFVTFSENAEEALDFAVWYAQNTYLSNGVEIEHRDNSFYCKYPNGNFVVLNKDGSINNYKITLDGGRIESFSSNTTITYDDGKTFTSSNAHAIETSNNILLCKSISDIKIKNGTLSYKDRSSEIYENGFVTASKVYLQDGGFYTTRKNGCNELTYPDGSVFKANTPNGLVLHKSDSTANTSADYVLLSGILTNSKGKEIEYRNGMPHYKYVDDLPQSSNLFQTNDRFSGAWDININGENKTGKQIMGLYKNDVVDYLEIADVKTELQKRAFVQGPDYATDYLPKLQEARKHLMNDEFMAWTPLGYRDYEVDDFEYDLKTGRFNFKISDTENKKINSHCKDFHFLLNKFLCLSYPRSLISMTKDGDYYIQKAQTCKVSEADALKFDNNKEDCALVWTFKVEKIVEMSLDRFSSVPVLLYGKSTHLYLANKETGEIYCDLSESLRASQNGFKSSKVIKDNSPKRIYHARGRMETCPLCLGNGDIKSWRDGSYNRCTTCGGKGWVIEHYW
jgi:hypothetical protein